MGLFKYLLLLPVFLFINCENDLDEPLMSSQVRLTQDSKVLSLMKAAIVSPEDYLTANKESLSKSTVDPAMDDQCTHFLYPMTFEVYSGDNPNPVLWEINSDEELLSFIDTLVASSTTYEYYIRFPITLLDTDGNPTVLENLEELEGTLQMAVEACEGMDNDPADGSGGSDDGSGGSGGSGDGSDGGSDDGSGGSGDGSEDGSNDGSEDGSNDGSDDGSNDGSDGGSNDDSGESDDDDSDDDSDDGDDEDESDGDDDDESDDDDDESDDEYEAEASDDNPNGYEYCDKKSKKVVICHKGITICISVNALWGHMQHHEEDYLGSCVD